MSRASGELLGTSGTSCHARCTRILYIVLRTLIGLDVDLDVYFDRSLPCTVRQAPVRQGFLFRLTVRRRQMGVAWHGMAHDVWGIRLNCVLPV